MLCMLVQLVQALDMSWTVVGSEGGYFIYCWGNNKKKTF